jgi:hypothetical protein
MHAFTLIEFITLPETVSCSCLFFWLTVQMESLTSYNRNAHSPKATATTPLATPDAETAPPVDGVTV